MKRASRHRLLLLVAASLLLITAGWQWQHDEAQAAGNLSKLDPANIQRIALTLPGAASLHYEKRGDHWWRTDGTPMRVNDARLNDLTDIAAAPVLSWRAASDFDPAKIGLKPPRATLVLDGQTLDFGEGSVTGPQHYVRIGQRIALISTRYMPRSPEAPITELQ